MDPHAPPREGLDLASLFSMDPAKGRISLGRERMLLVSADAMGALRRELHEALGSALAAEVLFRFGRRCGEEEAERILGEHGVDDREAALLMGPLLHAFEGVALVRTTRLRSDPAEGSFYMEGTWEGSYEADQHLRLFGASEEPVCRTLTGYATGYATVILGRELLCRETACRGRGDPGCAWTIAPAPAPEPEHLPEELRTAYHHLEQRIRGQQELFRSLTEVSDAIGTIVYTVDERGVVTSWNRTAAETFGFAPEQILGRHERLLFPGDRVAEREPEHLLERCRQGRVEEGVRRRIRADGTEFRVRGGRSPVRGADGRLLGATVVLSPLSPDLPGLPTGSPEAERTLKALLENVPAGIALATADQKLVECNRGFREMLGLADGPIEGLSCYALLAGVGSPCTDCPSHLVFEGGIEARCRPSFVRSDGRRVYFDLRSFPLRNSEGKVTHELKYVRDVTPEVEREREFEDHRRLAVVGEMAARVAHEVKNPLAGMRGALQVLASRRPAGDPEKEILGEVVAHIDRLDVTVRDLLSFSRPSQARLEPTLPADVGEAVISLLRSSPEIDGVDLRFERGAAPEVPLDRQQMVQVLTNLLQNAVQSLRPGDDRTILLSTGVTADGRSAEFRVRDRGPGIPPSARSRVFSPFFTTKARGTGLGLAICRKIVEAHRGVIEFECPPDGGTAFRVTLPLRAPVEDV
ncbi:MAG: PAS domain-containing protein [Planctomycetes bacterium]|nr:PAS domain-containing protein [Planctomycetota bacterium]